MQCWHLDCSPINSFLPLLSSFPSNPPPFLLLPCPECNTTTFFSTLDWRNACMLLWHLDRLCSPGSGAPSWLKSLHFFLHFFYKKSVLVICVGPFMFINFHNTNRRVIRNKSPKALIVRNNKALLVLNNKAQFYSYSCFNLWNDALYLVCVFWIPYIVHII